MSVKFLALLVLLTCSSTVSMSKSLSIAVTASFHAPLKEIISNYKSTTKDGLELNIISGSTGKLTSAIMFGAPYDIFFAADRKHPEILRKKGLVKKGSGFVYARGKLFLLGQNIECHNANQQLKNEKLRLSIANPKLAPYGLAAKQMLEGLDIWTARKNDLVMGENVSQVFQWFYQGAIDLALIGNSYVANNLERHGLKDKACKVDQIFYNPIDQELLVIESGRQELLEVSSFLKYFKESKDVHKIIKKYGYDNVLK